MGLADSIQNRSTARKHGATCSMSKLLETLTSEDREALETVLQDDTWTGVEIAATLQENGHKVGYWVVNRHRQRLCQCR